MEIATKYNPSEVETKWYEYWLKNKFFESKPDAREPYTIVIPPPNVTGVLHMGHMLNNTIQDVLIRHARMIGKNACWVPGTDHASIATEAKVVAKLAKSGINKQNLSRDEFLKHAWDWTDEYGGIILEQLKKLGASCDWSRTAFTMDEIRSKSVIKVFTDLYHKGLIYRGVRMVNWDPVALTALSDEEVIHKEEHGKLYYLKYKIEGSNDYAVIATTRPETIFGDVAVCINPNNPKTAHLRGKKVIVPICNRIVPIIEDEYVDVEFGTGCLKVTPAHDVNDYMLGEKYNLETLDIFNDNGTLNDFGLQYKGKDRFEVRKQIAKDLAEQNLLEKSEDYTNKVGYSERTHVPIEPKLSMQWFLKTEDLAKPALDAVENDTIKFYPTNLKNTYRHWMTNIKDWCISRQLWWGHRIPAYYLPNGKYIVAETEQEALEIAIKETNNDKLTLSDLRQDEDCLDTWFSSWLWPISLFNGILEPNNKEINYYYPTTTLVTGPDIIFFWVARMIMAGYEYMKEPCFNSVYFTGLVRDKLGRKMSKSLGNSPDSLELINKYGADGVRMGLLLTAPAGNDLPFDEVLCEQGRNFNNKIWNAFRLIKGWQIDDTMQQPKHSEQACKWFNSAISNAIQSINVSLSKFRLSEALMTIYKLFWDEFSSWYLEIVKPEYQKAIDKKTYDAVIANFDKLLKLLHPFMPFITEELWQALKERKDGVSIMYDMWPEVTEIDNNTLDDFNQAKEIVAGIRTIRLQKNIPNKEKLILESQENFKSAFIDSIVKICYLEKIDFEKQKSDNVSAFRIGAFEFAVQLNDMIDVEEEIKKIEKEIKYLQGFLISVDKKLNNEKFVNNAKPEIVEVEKKKKADALNKLGLLNESIKKLS